MSQIKSKIQIETIKDLLASGNFMPAKSLIDEWGEQIRTDLRAAKNSEERRRIFEDARTSAQESIYLAQVIRAHIGTQVASNSASLRYQDSDSPQNRWLYRG